MHNTEIQTQNPATEIKNESLSLRSSLLGEIELSGLNLEGLDGDLPTESAETKTVASKEKAAVVKEEAAVVKEETAVVKEETAVAQLAVLDDIEQQGGSVTAEQTKTLLAGSEKLGMPVEDIIQLVDVDDQHGGSASMNKTNGLSVSQQLEQTEEIVQKTNADENIWNDIFPTGDRAYQLLPRQAWIDFAETVRSLSNNDFALKNAITLIQKNNPESMLTAIQHVNILNDSGNGFDANATERWIASNLLAIETGDFSLTADGDSHESLAA